MKNLMGAILLSASAATMTYADGHALKIGFMATLEGPYTVLGEDSQRGFQLIMVLSFIVITFADRIGLRDKRSGQ